MKDVTVCSAVPFEKLYNIFAAIEHILTYGQTALTQHPTKHIQ